MIRLSEIFERSFRSDMEETKTAISCILSFLSHNAALTSYILNDLKLIFSELLYNAAIHGNRLDCGKRVHVRVEISGGDVYSIIRDEGNGFDAKALMKRIAGEQNLSGEHGRGIRLVLSLTDEISFNERGNEIRFRKKLVRK